ncbi:inositol monophosphatase [Paenibacillus antri]|uniref:Inositol monophosphatase n=1 Tax=Paenibacillus antri TaxID=2582848 RepID=A0A5R9GHT3_9BACL|nr:inositol monophosphatase [Paenibacillus antri]TLS52964.1 inositol monophosphatase [Paenibacillus antri]
MERLERQEQLRRAKQVATAAAEAAGRYAKERFLTAYVVTEKDEHGDLVTDVDVEAERLILETIRASFPHDAIRSEETGWSGVEGDWLWLVDPLDGTNNFAIGLPAFGVAITLLYRKEPVVGVVYESVTDRMYAAVAGQGATCNGEPLNVSGAMETPLRKRTVGWIQGHRVQKEPGAMRLKSLLDESCKRALRLWAPALLWTMLARGQLDGIVLYDSEGDDLYAGVLIAKEAGAAVLRFDGTPFDGMDESPYLVAGRGDAPEQLLRLAKDASSA